MNPLISNDTKNESLDSSEYPKLKRLQPFCFKLVQGTFDVYGLFSQPFRRQSVFIDIGAHIGGFSVATAKKNYSGDLPLTFVESAGQQSYSQCLGCECGCL